MVLQTGAAVGDEPDERYRGEAKIQKQVHHGALATSARPYDLIRATFLSDLIKELALTEKSAPAQMHISGITVEGDVWLTDSDIWSKISIDACVFQGSVFLTNSDFKRGLSFHRCRFEKPVYFSGSKVEGSAEFTYTNFGDSVTFANASIGGDLEMHNSCYQGSVDFSRLRVGSDFRLNECNFVGSAQFTNASIGKFLLIKYSFFRGAEEEVNFDNVKVGEDALVRAIFYGPVRWNYGEAKGAYYKESKFFDTFCFNSNSISHSVSFQACNLDKQFVCSQNKIGEDLDARSAHFKSKAFVSANKTAQSSRDRDVAESDFDADFYRTKVGRFARLNGATFDGSVSLERAELEDLDITSLKPWPRAAGTTRLADSTVKYFRAGPLEGNTVKWIDIAGIPIVLTPGKEGADGGGTLLAFLDNAEYDESLYMQLEQFLKAQGNREQADEVYIHGQERARDERLDCFSRAKSWILDEVTAYGRQPWRALVWAGVVVGIGINVFWSREDMEERKEEFKGRRYNPIWYSFDLFAPVIDLEAASVWAPKKDKVGKWFYLRIHRLLGWILVPIGIVAITGLLQGP